MRRYLLKHTAYALTLFAAVSIFMEGYMPGSVMPYLDPIPFAILAIIALALSAFYPVRASRPVAKTIVLMVLAFFAIAIVFLTFIASGLRTILAIGLFSASLVIAALVTGMSKEMDTNDA